MERKTGNQVLSKRRNEAQQAKEIERHLKILLWGGAPRMKFSDRDKQRIEPDYPDEFKGIILLMKPLGGADLDFVNGILNQLENATGNNRGADLDGLNFMLSVLKGLKPRDQVEPMLAAQMAAVHVAAMRLTRQLANAEIIVQLESEERAMNRLMQMFIIHQNHLNCSPSAIASASPTLSMLEKLVRPSATLRVRKGSPRF